MKVMGRPPKYKDAKEFDKKVDEYFEYIEEKKLPPTITGATIFLGFADKMSLYEYARKPDFTYSVKRVQLAVENAYEMNLHGNNVAGSVFALKNMGWRDKVETEISGETTVKNITVEFVDTKD